MNTVLILKVAVIIIAVITSRIFLRQIRKYLSPEQMNLLAENSSSISLLKNFLVYGAAAFLFVMGRFSPELIDTLQIMVLVVMSVGMSVVVWLSYRQFNKLNLPAKARHLYVLSVASILLGIIFILLPI